MGKWIQRTFSAFPYSPFDGNKEVLIYGTEVITQFVREDEKLLPHFQKPVQNLGLV